MMLVSIIVPVYNLENYIAECIRSILQQTYKNLEILLIDDGSSDHSYAVCERFARIDSRIRVLHHSNRGVSFTRNRGIDAATGDYIMFVDGDDFIEQDFVEMYVDTAVEYQADVVIGGLKFFLEDGTVISRRPLKAGCYGNEIWEEICRNTDGIFGYAAGKMYLSEILQVNLVRFDINMYAQEDLDFALSAYYYCSRFCTMDYDGYGYLYCPGKHGHPYEMYIKNQIKLLRYAIEKGDVGAEEQEAAAMRVQGLLYVALYHCRPDQFKNMAVMYTSIDGLQDILNLLTGEEKTLVTRLFLNKRIIMLKRYFIIRKGLGRMLHRMTGSGGDSKDEKEAAD